MIIKSLTRKRPSFDQLIRYITEQKEDNPELLFTHNLRGNSVEEWVQSFSENESYRKHRRKNSVILSHEVLSWHKEDSKHLNMERIEAMTREYIRLRNPHGMYLAVAHLDKDKHYHVHLVVSGVEYRSGKSMRMSKQAFRQVKQRLEAFQRANYPELAFSEVNHGRPRPYPKEPEFRAGQRSKHTSSKEALIIKLEDAFQKASSLKSFLEKLEAQGIKPYYRGGKLTGVWFGKAKARKYRFRRLGFPMGRLLALDRQRERGRNMD